jgi:acyl carrier protein
MTGESIEPQVKHLFQSLFSVQPEAVTDGLRRGVLERWDSLGHLNLIEALQEKFQIEIPLEMALEMETFGDVNRIVAQLLSVTSERRTG